MTLLHKVADEAVTGHQGKVPSVPSPFIALFTPSTFLADLTFIQTQ